MAMRQLQVINQQSWDTEYPKISSRGDEDSMNDNEGIARLEVKVDSIENTLQEMKTDIRELRQEVKTDMQNLRQEVRADIRDLRQDIHAGFKWMLGLMITSGLSVVMSIVTAILHFIK